MTIDHKRINLPAVSRPEPRIKLGQGRELWDDPISRSLLRTWGRIAPKLAILNRRVWWRVLVLLTLPLLVALAASFAALCLIWGFVAKAFMDIIEPFVNYYRTGSFFPPD